MTRLHEEGARQDEKQRREARATGLQQSAVRRIAHRGLARERVWSRATRSVGEIGKSCDSALRCRRKWNVFSRT